MLILLVAAPALLPSSLARRTVNVPLSSSLSIGVIEIADWKWWEEQSIGQDAKNPHGAKLWPAAVAISQRLTMLPHGTLHGKTVLELGCGNGLCSLAAAAAGAESVIASDLSVDALGLTSEAAKAAKLTVETRVFDLDGKEPLPDADLVICADLLYDDRLAALVAVRVVEARQRGSWVLVADPRRGPRETFLKKMKELTPPTEPLALFDESRKVRLPQVGWKEKGVEIMSLHSPHAWHDSLRVDDC